MNQNVREFNNGKAPSAKPVDDCNDLSNVNSVFLFEMFKIENSENKIR